MRNDLSELIFILDRSGSMSGLELDTIGGFNSLLSRQQSERGHALISTVLFDDKVEVLHDRIDIRETLPLTERDYWVRGSTALLDAIGGAIRHIERVHSQLPADEIPEHTLFAITTDGMENASHHYSLDEIRHLIADRTENDGWEFLFLGANMDAVKTAGNLGIAPDRAANFLADEGGIELGYEAMAYAVSEMRAPAPPIGAGLPRDAWKSRVEKDCKKRGRRKS